MSTIFEKLKYIPFFQTQLNNIYIWIRQRESPDVPCTDESASADVLAASFAGVFSIEPPGNVPSVGLPRYAASLDSIEMNELEVRRLLTELDLFCAPGPDEISAMVLKTCADSLTAPITKIIRHSLLSCHELGNLQE